MIHIFQANQSLIIGVVTAFFVSLLLTGLIIPKVLLIAFRKNLFDESSTRKIHKGSIPRLGGIAFLPALIFSVCIVFGIYNFPFYIHSPYLITSSYVRAICFSLCGVLLLYLVGIADDLVGVLYRAKFMIQLLSAALLICGGIWIANLHGFCGVYEWPDVCGCMLTVLVVLFFVNAINLIDGIDGLASGLSCVALLFYGVIFCYVGDITNALISFALLGSLVQFFYYNVFGNAKMGKKIFMGDTGALCVGFVLTYLSISLCNLDTIGSTDLNPIVVAFCPMLVPCFDVLRVFFGRIRTGKSPFLPDKTHIHHKLLRLGMTTPRAMVSILSMSVGLIIINVLLSPVLNSAILMALDLVLWVLYIELLNCRIKRYEQVSKGTEG